MSRLNLIAIGVWLLGVLLLYICSWPAYESMIPTDRKVVSISEDGRYLATVVSPAKLVKTIGGVVKYRGNQLPRGPIEIWDARGGTVLHSIECGTDIVQTVHVMDSGNLVVASFGHPDSPGRFGSTVYQWKDDATQPSEKQIPGQITSCQTDVDGTVIAVVRSDASNANVTDLRSGKELLRFSSSWHWKVLVHPDGTRVVTIESPTEDGYTIRVLDTKTGNSVGSFLEPDFPKAWTLSADGKTLWIAVVNPAKNEASLHGWDIESCQRHTSIAPPGESPFYAMLMSVWDLEPLTPPFLRFDAVGKFPALIRMNESSFEIVDARVDRDLFAEDGSLQVEMDYESSGDYCMIVRRMDDRSEVFRLPGKRILKGISPDSRYAAIQNTQRNEYGLSALRRWLSGWIHTPPQASSHSARAIHAVDLRDGSTHLIGVIPRQRFKYFENDGFIDGGKRILVNNYIWKFGGHRPWALILLVPSLLVAVFYWTVKRWRPKGTQPVG